MVGSSTENATQIDKAFVIFGRVFMPTDVYIKGVCPCAFPQNMVSIYYPLFKNLGDGFDLVTEVRFF